MSKPLTDLESAVLELLLSRDEAGYDVLREQLAGCSVKAREQCSAGFFTELAVDLEARPVDTALVGNPLGEGHDFPDHVAAEVQGLEWGAGFLLWLEDGYLSQLEGFSYAGDGKSPRWDGEFAVRWEPITRLRS